MRSRRGKVFEQTTVLGHSYFIQFVLHVIRRAERELLEAERKEREQMDLQRIQVEKQVMQQKLKLNQQAMSKAAKSAKPTAGRYCFEMLNTDDETDDESHPVAGRPLPPSWSLRKYSVTSVCIGYMVMMQSLSYPRPTK